MTSTTVAVLQSAWLVLLFALAYLHRDRLVSLKVALTDRLTRKPNPAAPPVADPVAPL